MKDTLDNVERVFLAFGDKTRLRLLQLMQYGEVSVNYLCETLGESQPKVSRHLAYLRTTGMVQTRRDGKWIYYSLTRQDHEQTSILIRDTLNLVGSILRANDGVEQHGQFEREMREEDLRVPEMPYTYGNTDVIERSDELEIYLL